MRSKTAYISSFSVNVSYLGDIGVTMTFTKALIRIRTEWRTPLDAKLLSLGDMTAKLI